MFSRLFVPTSCGTAMFLATGAQAAPVATLLDESGSSTGKVYGARITQRMYIIGPPGRVLYGGGIDSIPFLRGEDFKTAVNCVRQGLQQALSAKPISVSASNPFGCSVKYKS